MSHPIMVPVDGSPFAEQALPFALALARRTEGSLQLVTVRASLRVDSRAERAEQQYVEELASQLEPQLPGRVETHVLTDEYGPLHYPPPAPRSVAEVLAKHARDENVDTIVMSTHGYGGVRRAWLGSVADALIRIAHRPVLLVRPKDEAFGTAAEADRGFNHILVPLDGSRLAEQALDPAVRIGSAFGARYTVVRVVSPLAWQVADEHGPDEPAPPLSRRAAQEYIDGVVERLGGRGLEVTGRLIDAMSPGPAIIDHAAEHAADLIVVTTRGAGTVQRLLLGSTTDKIVRGVDVPVLVVSAPDDGPEPRVLEEAGAAGAGDRP